MSMHVVRVLMEILDNQTMQHVQAKRMSCRPQSLGHPGGNPVSLSRHCLSGRGGRADWEWCDPCLARLHAFRFMRPGEMVPHACTFGVPNLEQGREFPQRGVHAKLTIDRCRFDTSMLIGI
jgi:hypothetical protein